MSSLHISLSVIIFAVFILGTAGLTASFVAEKSFMPLWLFIFCISLWLVLVLYLFLRLYFAKKGMKSFLELLLRGDFKAGIGSSKWVRDEITDIAEMSNKVGESLFRFEKLRAEKVALSHAVLEIIFNRISEPAILIDAEEETLRFNPAIQSLYGVFVDKITFAAIEKQSFNTKFNRHLALSLIRDKIEKNFEATLQLPSRGKYLKLDFHFLPVKGKDENVKYALMFVKKTEGNSDNE